jgi:hypothetical protein
MISPDWREIPEGIRSHTDLSRALAAARYFQGDRPAATWIQHGDLSVENTHIDRKTGEFEVFDWGDLAGGFPPLYDFFQFFYSTGYLAPAEETARFASEEDRWIATFKAVYLSDSKFGRLAQQLLRRACERLHVSPPQVPSLLLEFLIIRCNYYPRESVQHRAQSRLLEMCIAEFEKLRLGWE